jgi:hypothetical protein
MCLASTVGVHYDGSRQAQCVAANAVRCTYVSVRCVNLNQRQISPLKCLNLKAVVLHAWQSATLRLQK